MNDISVAQDSLWQSSVRNMNERALGLRVLRRIQGQPIMIEDSTLFLNDNQKYLTHISFRERDQLSWKNLQLWPTLDFQPDGYQILECGLE